MLAPTHPNSPFTLPPINVAPRAQKKKCTEHPGYGRDDPRHEVSWWSGR